MGVKIISKVEVCLKLMVINAIIITMIGIKNNVATKAQNQGFAENL
jgi:hypothetical protein